MIDTQRLRELLDKSLGRSYSLGQTYWMQADSESYSQNRKANETQTKFDRMRAETNAELAALLDELDALRERAAERDAFQREANLNAHKVITCGVAARHPDPNLSRTGAYAGKWDSPQALAVRALRDERDRLRGLVSELADNDTYETEYDGRMYSICHGCGAQDGEPHRRPDCLYIRARAALNTTTSGVSA